MRSEIRTFEKRFRIVEDFQHGSPLNFPEWFVQEPVGTASKSFPAASCWEADIPARYKN